jgi:hypothetical protein
VTQFKVIPTSLLSQLLNMVFRWRLQSQARDRRRRQHAMGADEIAAQPQRVA